MVVTLIFGYDLIDAENFIPANQLVTPTHIQPEWYFLFAYAILRSIPNKLGGVACLVLALLVLFLFSICSSKLLFSGIIFSPISRFLFWSLFSVFVLLTWLGSCEAESPFNEVALFCTIAYYILVRLRASWSHIIEMIYFSN
jgi:ubiquinol-cytochrome c reductase cytochrome b subunit